MRSSIASRNNFARASGTAKAHTSFNTQAPGGPRYRIDQHGTPHDPATVKDQPFRYLTHLLSRAEVRKITHRLSWTKCLDAKALGIKCITSDDGEGH